MCFLLHLFLWLNETKRLVWVKSLSLDHSRVHITLHYSQLVCEFFSALTIPHTALCPAASPASRRRSAGSLVITYNHDWLWYLPVSLICKCIVFFVIKWSCCVSKRSQDKASIKYETVKVLTQIHGIHPALNTQSDSVREKFLSEFFCLTCLL